MPRLTGEMIRRALDANGYPVSGAKLSLFEAGTSTPASAFSDLGLTTAHASPVVADSSGVFPPIYVAPGAYKVTLTTSADAVLPGSPVDHIHVAETDDTSVFNAFAGIAAATIPATVETVETRGYASAGDGGGAVYVRSETSTITSGGAQSADGAYWTLVPIGGIVHPEQFGAVGDGSTDDTAAFTRMFSYAENVADQETYTSATQRNIIGVAGGLTLWLSSDRHYRYGGTGWRPASGTGARSIIIRSGGRNGALVEITSDAYLIDIQIGGIELNAIHAEGFNVAGGKGFYCNRVLTAIGQGGRYFHNLQIIDFSECAIAEHRGDCPRFVVTDCTIESSLSGTVGVFLPLVVAGPHMAGTSIIGCKYGLILYGKPGTSIVGQAATFLSGMRFFNIPAQTGHVADVWLQTHDTTASFQNAGQHVVVSGNTFSNENRAGAQCILIAARNDSDTGVALHMRPHLATETTQVARDMIVSGNIMLGGGLSDETDPAVTGSMILSYTQELGAMRVFNNYISTAFTEILEIVPTPGTGYASNLVIGPNTYSGTGERPLPCNRNFGAWFWDDGEHMPSFGTPVPAAGWDTRFALLSRVSTDPVTMGETTLSGDATSGAATDALGGTDALTCTFTATTEYLDIPIAGVDAIPAGQLIYVEVDIKQAASLTMSEVDVVITLTGTGISETIRRGYLVPSAWMTVRIPVQANGALTSATVRVYPSPDGFTASTADAVIIGRPRVYAGNVPTNFGHFGTNNSAWNAGRLIFNGPEGQTLHIWPDWTSSTLQMKFAAPSSEADGLTVSAS